VWAHHRCTTVRIEARLEQQRQQDSYTLNTLLVSLHTCVVSADQSARATLPMGMRLASLVDVDGRWAYVIVARTHSSSRIP
jgi:hypothetical protein